MQQTQHIDPAQPCVDINRLSHELQDILAFAGEPDRKRLMEVATEIRDRAGQIRMWAMKP